MEEETKKKIEGKYNMDKIEPYRWDKNDESLFRDVMFYQNKSIGFLLTCRESICYYLERCIKKRELEKIAGFWLEEYTINYFLEKKGYNANDKKKESENNVLDEFMNKDKINRIIESLEEVVAKTKK